ncbi:MAG TPA: rod-binding protein, partial [Candidatus Xenobia bacterium]
PVPPQQQPGYDPAVRQREEAKLKDASKQFEQQFIMQLFKEMRKGESKSELFGEKDDQSQDTYKEMLDQERAKAWVDNGGIGMAQMIYEQMRTQVPDKPPTLDDDPLPGAAQASAQVKPDRKTDPAT